MKKLALALVCLVSVAFFASCTPEGQPTIQVLAEEGYVVDNQVVDLNTDLNYGFVMASSAETNKDLKQLVVKIDDGEETVVDLTGMKEYTFRDVIKYTLDAKDIIAESMITATVTDVAGQTATATITLSINEEQPLISSTFHWYRLGNTITGLDEFGLTWKGNYPKDIYAKLVPQDGVKLYIFESQDWEETNTVTEKAALFSNENLVPADEYWNVNVTQQDMTYDDVIGTMKPDGTCYLIHVTNSHSVSLNAGTETDKFVNL